MNAIQVVGVKGEHACRRLQKKLTEELTEDITHLKVLCFAKVICAEDFTSALPLLLQIQGCGPLQENTILTNWFNNPDKRLLGLERLKYGHNLRTAFHQGYNLVIFHCEDSKWQGISKPEGKRDRIDIWWQGEDNSSRLMLLFAYLVTRKKIWRDAEIRVLTTGKGAVLAQVKEQLMQVFDEARIPAEPHMVADMEPETVLANSKDSSLVFLPFKIQQSRLTDVRGYSLERILPQLPPTALIKAAEVIDLDAEPEEGIAGDLAKAMDKLNVSEKQLRAAEREEQKHLERLETLKLQLTSAGENQDEENLSETITPLQKTLDDAEQIGKSLFHKTAKAMAKNQTAIEDVRKLGGSINDDEEEDA